MSATSVPRFSLSQKYHTVSLEQTIGGMVIQVSHVRADNHLTAGEVAKSFMATPHHWRVWRSYEEQ